MHGNDRSTSQISLVWIDLFDDNMENIVDTYRISIKSIDNTYRIGSMKWYRALLYLHELIINGYEHITAIYYQLHCRQLVAHIH